MILTVTGIEETIATLEKAEKIDKPIKEAIYMAMQEAENLVLNAYRFQSVGKNDDYYTKIEEIPNGYTLTASGEDVGFLEFGVGIMTTPDEFADEVSFPVYVGSYSEANQGQFMKSGYRFWWFGKSRYTGLLPTRGMQRALDYLMDNITSIIEEKINEWIGN